MLDLYESGHIQLQIGPLVNIDFIFKQNKYNDKTSGQVTLYPKILQILKVIFIPDGHNTSTLC